MRTVSTSVSKLLPAAAVMQALLMAGCAAPPKILETEAVHLDVVQSGKRYIETARLHDKAGQPYLMGRVRFPVPHVDDPVDGHVDRTIFAGEAILAECTMPLRASLIGPPGASAVFYGPLPVSDSKLTVRLAYHDEDQHGADCDG